MKKFLVLFLLLASVACAEDFPGTYAADSVVVGLATNSVTLLSTTATFLRGDFVTVQFRGNAFWAWGSIASAALVTYNTQANGDTISFRWGGADISLIASTAATCSVVINRQRDF